MTEQVLTSVPGMVWKVHVKPGDHVTQGQSLFILELMKTEIDHASPVAGVVTEVHIAEQDMVDADFIAIELNCDTEENL